MQARIYLLLLVPFCGYACFCFRSSQDHPVALHDSDEDRARNRRVDIVILNINFIQISTKQFRNNTRNLV
jgi:hypothetical protein